MMQPFEWDGVSLAVFDLDGTLYRQAPLRRQMAAEMAMDALASRSLQTIRVVAAYRRLREALGEAETQDFEPVLLSQCAAATGMATDAVHRLAQEWLERRPLQYLARCRYPHVAAVFEGMRRAGLSVAVLSDYPAAAKLAALGLTCDHVVWAGDPGIGILKPNPSGLAAIMHRTGASPAATVVIGDRIDRDGAAARRAGARALIRSSKSHPGWHCFTAFDDAVFRRFL